MRSLISESAVIACWLFRQCLSAFTPPLPPPFFVAGRVGVGGGEGLIKAPELVTFSLVRFTFVSWHTCSVDSSAGSIQDLPRPSRLPFVSFTASVSGLWELSTASSYPETYSTFWSQWVLFWVVPSKTVITPFSTLSS